MADAVDPDDAGWLVPEGYLSEGEGVESDDESSGRVISRPVVRPAKKYTSIRPVAIGPIFDDGDDDGIDALKLYEIKMIGDFSTPYDPTFIEPKSSADPTSSTGNGDELIKRINFTNEQATELRNIIEGGKTETIPKLIVEAKANKLLQNVPKRQIEMKIKDLAVKEKRGLDTKATWYVKKEDGA
ncbi:hypothetical protein BX666DRAFT_840086 [Dichotomocladium elegans]|nr:hypothetical protein BX666DRAFT_840086 [Dichotomocladium elegans]